MGKLSAYNIDIQGLKEVKHQYFFDSGSDFFQHLEQDLVEKGHFKVELLLDKSSTMMLMDFNISGSVELICDRSLESFDEPIDVQQRFILKFGDHDEELAENIEMIRHETVRINVARYIFDFIALALPMKRLHPRLRTEDDEDQESIYFSTDDVEEQIEEIDERWASLKSLKK